MSDILLQIDGKEVSASEGMTLLEAARSAGIEIPTLCHHDKLEPYGACRLCIVEIEDRGRTKIVVSCVYLAQNGLSVRTRSEKIDRIRKTILELLLAHAPDAVELQKLAEEYGADRDRFEKEPMFCIHCGLCVRY
jgi:NADH dehydrogenase/NADH:ubiquinone oxidoreductase subunit G